MRGRGRVEGSEGKSPDVFVPSATKCSHWTDHLWQDGSGKNYDLVQYQRMHFALLNFYDDDLKLPFLN